MPDSSFAPPPPQLQLHQVQYDEGFLTQQQQQLRYQQQQQNFELFLGMRQPGGRPWFQPERVEQLNQQQRHAPIHMRTPHPGGIQTPRPVRLQTFQHPAKSAALARAKPAEAAERVRLQQEERREREKRAKRRAELKKDPSANYRYYKEYLEYFPLARGERPNDYLLGLLANQSMPAEPTSDMGLAVQYARANWENAWEIENLDYVVGMAKKEVEKKKKEHEGSRTLG
ncbi:hypothetical protein E8E11_010606 [Didymella keratinophila]|nr:hypothetical protein E8E11_010606 [Didymella keratinophila]